MKKLLPVLCLLVVLAACNKTLQDDEVSNANAVQLSVQQLDDVIKTTELTYGKFDWNKQSDQVVWSALQHGDDVLSIGYKPAGHTTDISKEVHNIDIQSGEWKAARLQLLEQILQEERKVNAGVTIEQLIAYKEEVLPVLDVHIKNISTISMLRKSNLVRYAEPMGYEPNAGLFGIQKNIAQTSAEGCGSNTAEAGLTTPADYLNIFPGSKESWHYNYHNIAGAWTKSSGAGKKVMVIDTGISPDQALFHNLLNSGSSSGRTLEKKVTLRKSAWFGLSYGSVETSVNDACGHGTSMIGALASPRNTEGGMVGVAYNASVISVRASADVLIDESRENKGVSDAFVLAGNTSSVQIVSMSMGRITSSSQLGDAVDYAYNKGKLIFCAAGTSFGWSAGWWGVVFPASKSNVQAVTGVKDDTKTRCDACHVGPEVDFVIVMEKASNGRTALSTAQSGYAPATVGGSSVATATASGIAALVWSKNPGYSREQVVSIMQQSSAFYPSKNSSIGWGIPNADLATQ